MVITCVYFSTYNKSRRATCVAEPAKYLLRVFLRNHFHSNLVARTTSRPSSTLTYISLQNASQLTHSIRALKTHAMNMQQGTKRQGSSVRKHHAQRHRLRISTNILQNKITSFITLGHHEYNYHR